jgi:hypothetical protein
MSLISFRNLTSPLRSKFQIGALVILALLVAAVRYGASSRQDRSLRPSDGRSGQNDERPIDLEAHREEIIDFLDETNKRLKVSGPKKADSELQGLVDGSYDRDVRREREARQPNEKFQDIRKSLGLE